MPSALSKQHITLPPWLSKLILSTMAIAMVLVVYRDFFFPWQSLAGGDIIGVHAPYLVGFKRALAYTAFPMWFSEICCGVVAIPDINVNLLHPLYQGLRWLEVCDIIKLQVLINFMILFWGNLNWLKRHHNNEFTCIFISFFSLIMFWVHGILSFGHLGIFSALCLLPWALSFAHDIIHSQHDLPSIAKLGIVLGVSWITGHPQINFIMHEVILIIILSHGTLFSPLKYKKLLSFGIAIIIGLTLASPQLYTTFIHILESGRISSQTDVLFQQSGALNLLNLARWVNPFLFGDPLSYWGQYTFWYGALISSPLLFSIIITKIKFINKRMTLLCIGLITLSLGHHTLLYDLHQKVMPGADFFRYPSRYSYFLAPFLLLILAKSFQPNQIKDWKTIGLLTISIGMISLAWYYCPNSYLTHLIRSDILERRTNPIPNSWITATMLFQGFLITMAVTLKKHHLSLIFCTLLIGQIVIITHQDFANVKIKSLPLPHVERNRVYTPHSNKHNDGLIGNFESLSGYIGLTPRKYREFLDTQTPQQFNKKNRLQISFIPELTLNELSVTHIKKGDQIMPRANDLSIKHKYRFINEEEYLLFREGSIFSQPIQQQQSDLFREFNKMFPHPPKDHYAPSPSLIFKKQETERIQLLLKTDQPRILIGIENNHPLWKATLNGKPVPIRYWWGTFRAIFIPAGEHQLTLFIDRSTFNLFLVISLFSLFVTLFFAHTTPRTN